MWNWTKQSDRKRYAVFASLVDFSEKKTFRRELRFPAYSYVIATKKKKRSGEKNDASDKTNVSGIPVRSSLSLSLSATYVCMHVFVCALPTYDQPSPTEAARTRGNGRVVQLPGVTCILHPTGRADLIVLSRVGRLLRLPALTTTSSLLSLLWRFLEREFSHSVPGNFLANFFGRCLSEYRGLPLRIDTCLEYTMTRLALSFYERLLRAVGFVEHL